MTDIDFVDELPASKRGGGKKGSKYEAALPALQAQQGRWGKVQGWQDKPVTAGQAFRNLGCLTSTRTRITDAGDKEFALYAVWPTDEQAALDNEAQQKKAQNKANKAESSDIFGRDVA